MFSEAGFVCKSEDEIVERIIDLIEDEKLRKQLSLKARMLAEKYFNEDVVFQKYVELYKSMEER
ncbi:MAG: hypothetical protein DRP00_02255 [Candidatus Aenigmatarchaeota archaeon]|nr:MAG: hypothetical protein DRP00_02255 [Candidatus Aenigmarchaeota archaeon]